MKEEQPTNMDLEKADKNNTGKINIIDTKFLIFLKQFSLILKEAKEAEGASKAPVKRKAKNDISVSNEEGWLKRRSLRVNT